MSKESEALARAVMDDIAAAKGRISQVRLGDIRVRAEKTAKLKGLSLSAAIRLALSEWLERQGG